MVTCKGQVSRSDVLFGGTVQARVSQSILGTHGLVFQHMMGFRYQQNIHSIAHDDGDDADKNKETLR
jgi:hypothetical protein